MMLCEVEKVQCLRNNSGRRILTQQQVTSNTEQEAIYLSLRYLVCMVADGLTEKPEAVDIFGISLLGQILQ